MRRRLRHVLPLVLLLGAALAGPAAARVAAGAEQLVPAVFGSKSDSQGFNWDVNQAGIVADGTNDCFDGGLALTIDGSSFSPSQALMTQDGRELVLSGQYNAISITRRILFDAPRAALRYLEIFENPSRGPITLSVALCSSLGGGCSGVVTNTGGSAGNSLGQGEIGVLAIQQPHGSRPSVMFLVADDRGQVKPQVNIDSNYRFTFTYQLTVAPGRSAVLLHLVAQRNASQAPSPTQVFEPFYDKGRLVQPEVPPSLRGAVVNFSASALSSPPDSGGFSLRAVLALAQSLNVDRSTGETLILDDPGRLTGKIADTPLRLVTPHGPLDLPLADLALLQGGGGTGRPLRLYLRNGESLTGELQGAPLRLAVEPGGEVELVPERLRMLFFRTDARDGWPAPETLGFLLTRRGERLALKQEAPTVFTAATAWGLARFPLAQVERLDRLAEPEPLHRLTLKDGSRLTVILADEELTFTTQRFGQLRLAPHEVAGLIRIQAQPCNAPIQTADWPTPLRRKVETPISLTARGQELSEILEFLGQPPVSLQVRLDAPEAPAPAMAAGGDRPTPAPGLAETPITLELRERPVLEALNQMLLSAKLWLERDGETLTFSRRGPLLREAEDPNEAPPASPFFRLAGENVLTGTFDSAKLTVATGAGLIEIDPQQLLTLERANAGDTSTQPIFAFELAGGQVITGRLREPLLSIRSGEQVWRVPLAHLMGYYAKEPSSAAKTATPARGSSASPSPPPVLGW